MLRRLALAALLALSPALALAQVNSPQFSVAAYSRWIFSGNQTFLGNLTVNGNLTVGGSVIDGNGILATNIAAPATPAAGTTRIYVDSTTKTVTGKNDAGTLSNTVAPTTCSASQWINAIAANAAVTCAQPAIGDVAGLGTGVATAAAINIGTAGSFVTNGGALGTPSSGVGTNLTALNASNLASGTVAAARGGAGTVTGALKGSGAGVVSQAACADLSNAAASCSTDATNATNITSGTLPTARLSLAPITNSLGADVLLNNTGLFFDGPSVAQGLTGTWWASGTATVIDTAGVATVFCKLWDGTTVISSALGTIAAANGRNNIALSGFIASPAGNLRISCQDGTSTSGKILFNASGTSKDSTISAFRIQ